MKTLMGLIATMLVAAPTLAADVGVSISIGEPNFYGRIDIGGAPPPVLVYSQPVVVMQVPQAAPPIYLRVPPDQSGNWKQYCGAYGACDRPVYFVQDSWYHDVYTPHYRKQHGHGGGDDHGNGKNKGKGHDKGHKN
ncbi:MAG: hypothetical protein WC809_10965 [Sinimarinibacterium sp.]